MSTCKNCGHDIVEIDISRNGLDFTMRSCGTCDTRSWAVDGAPSRLPAVLRSLADVQIPVEATAV